MKSNVLGGFLFVAILSAGVIFYYLGEKPGITREPK